MQTKQVWKIDKRGCLYLLPSIEDKSIDMILTDLPYGTTACSWDTIIPFKSLWEQYKRIIKDNGAIVLTSREPFTSALLMSNVNDYKHKWVWNKKQGGSFLNCKYMPHQIEEDILVFASGMCNYHPLMRNGKRRIKGGAKKDNGLFKDLGAKYKTFNNQYYPVNIIEFPNCSNKENNVHPTQKPVALFEYLIKTYTNEGDTVHDSCIGSGTTLEACLNTNRNGIGFEISDEWVPHYRKRLRLNNSKLTDTWDCGAIDKVA